MTSNNIGEIIKNTRRELGITQKELCVGICSESQLSKIESGRQEGGWETRRLLLERLGYNSRIMDKMDSAEC